MDMFGAPEAKTNPEVLYKYASINGTRSLSSSWLFNPGMGEYYDGHENKYAVFFSDDWTLSRRLWMSLGARMEYQGYSGKDLAMYNSDGSVLDASVDNTRTGSYYFNASGKGKIMRFTGDFINPSVAYNVRYTLSSGFGLLGEYVYVRQRPNLQDYAGAYYPITSPVNVNMGRAGIFWNNSYIQLVSQFSYITQTNYKARSTFYNPSDASASDISTIPVTYNVKTMGWTTDFVLSPFKGFTFHGLLTLQNPTYQKFRIQGTFNSGTTFDVDVSGNVVTAMSKTLIELDPSYSWDKGRWSAGLNFRYFSKQYINKTNSLYFNGHWESFGHLNYLLNKNVFFSLNVVNFLNQVGASGSISAADLVTKTDALYKKYSNNYTMVGSYLRPFEVSLSTTINF